MLTFLQQLADKLDKNKFLKQADMIDKLINKIAEEDDDDKIVDPFGAISDEKEIKDDPNGVEYILASFLEALVEGTFASLEEAKKVAHHILEKYYDGEDLLESDLEKNVVELNTDTDTNVLPFKRDE